MTKYTSLAIALTATTFLSAPAIAASLTPTLEENSVFAYSEGSENDYNFTLQEADAEGNLTTKYYKIDLKPEAFSTSKSISWTEVGADQKDTAGVVEVKLPNDQAKYFKYTYAQPANYETVTEPESVFPTVTDPTEEKTRQPGGIAVNNTAGNNYGDVKNKLFKDNRVSGELSNVLNDYRYLYVEGGAIYNDSTIDNVEADFINNSANATAAGRAEAFAEGGAIYNNGTMSNISGSFIGNYTSGSHAEGGAVYNHDQGTISNITGDFIGNYAKNISYTAKVRGGAIYNNGTIEHINGDFIGNYAQYSRSDSSGYGGAVYNSGTMNSIIGDFIGNYTSGSYAYGGAIYNNGTIDKISGNFISNRTGSYGGAVMNGTFGEGTTKGKISNITGDFIGNHSDTHSGAIYNHGTIDDINGDFVGNSAELDGGALDSPGTIGTITGDFVANSAGRNGGAMVNGGYTGKISNISGDFVSNSANESGGAIYNNGTIEHINGDFIGNHAQGNRYIAGGAIYNVGTIGTVTGDLLHNSVKIVSGTETAVGGAVRTFKNMTFSSGSDVHFISENYTLDPTRGKIFNAVSTKNSPTVTFDTTGGGAWVVNDNIENGNYVFKGNDTIDASTGTTTQYVAMNNDIVNAANVKVEGTTLRFDAYQHEDQTAKNWDGKGAFVASLNADGTANRAAAAVTNLSLNNSVFDIANGYLETVKLKSYSATDSFLHIDVDPDNMAADVLNVAGNVEGVTKMIVHASSDTDIRNRGQILFAQSENDATGNAGSFVVSRVYKSPYLFEVKYDQIASNSNKWYFEMNDQPNEGPKEPEKPEEPDVPTPPTPEKPDVPDVPTPPTPELPDIPSIKPQPLPGSDRPVAPEVIGAESLPAAALAQNTNMIYNIMQKVSSNRFYCPGCGFYDYYWNGEAFHNLWANAVYNTLRIKTPTDIDAEVWGIEAGGDLQHDINNKLGLFLSYRKGNYDMNGDGKHHYSTIGSEIDIDSYLAGLYYRYDRNNWWGFATVYGGIQKADLKTKDGIKSDTDGVEFGGSVELGYDYAVNKTVYLTPSVGAFYTQVDYDDARDSAGKVAKYNTLRQLELEAGVKLTKAFVMDEGYANVYVKPSVVRTITDGDEVRITGLGKVNTLEDQTLGRIEVGGRYGFTEQLSAYGWANHTFGDDYKASTAGLGLSYNW